MAKMVPAFSAAAVVVVVFYALGVFIEWDANPGQWSMGFRVALGYFGLCCATLAWFIAAAEFA